MQITVTFQIDAASTREAEKMLDSWLSRAEDDDRLIGYNVVTSSQVEQDVERYGHVAGWR